MRLEAHSRAAGPIRPRKHRCRLSRNPSQKGSGSMDAIMNFLGNTWVMVGMGAALLALIGVMIFLRMKPRDE